jgi:hypothetical protein
VSSGCAKPLSLFEAVGSSEDDNRDGAPDTGQVARHGDERYRARARSIQDDPYEGSGLPDLGYRPMRAGIACGGNKAQLLRSQHEFGRPFVASLIGSQSEIAKIASSDAIVNTAA